MLDVSPAYRFAHSFQCPQTIPLYPCVPIPFRGTNNRDSKSNVFLAEEPGKIRNFASRATGALRQNSVNRDDVSG